jgi:hypothetical protein
VEPLGPVRVVTGLLAGAGAVGAVGAVAALLLTRGADAADPSRSQMLIAYGGASVGVLAVVCLTTLAVLLVGSRPRR